MFDKDEKLIQRNFYLRQTKVIRTKTGLTHIKKPKTTVVLLIDPATGNYSRGIAVCNDSDNFCKKTGRTIALNRAKKALGQKKSCPNNSMRADQENFMLPWYVVNKCSFMPPDLMPFEQAALEAWVVG